MPNYETTIRIAPGHDSRDEGGGVTALGIIFDLQSPRARVSWGINTGWVQRPVLTAELQPGAQIRGDRPGVDSEAVLEFPQPLIVSIVDPAAHPGEADIDHPLGRTIFSPLAAALAARRR